jgi:hypothetical protein
VTQRGGVAVAGGRDRARRMVTINFGASILLLVQYLLGMAANLYVTIPAHHPGANAANYLGGVVSGVTWVIPHGPGWLAAHAALGVALVLAAFGSLAVALRLRRRAYTATSLIGALAILGAGFNGASFLNYGQQFSSMIMAGLWALALGSYVTGLFVAARRPEALPR